MKPEQPTLRGLEGSLLPQEDRPAPDGPGPRDLNRPGSSRTGRPAGPGRAQAAARRRANDLDGRTWERYSISVWSDIRKTPEEARLGHPAMFPADLVVRLIRCFTTREDRVVLDPFAGSGATVVAAQALGKVGVGLEIHPHYCELARTRPLMQPLDFDAGGEPAAAGRRVVLNEDARQLLRFVERESVDLVITSPPYWDVLLRTRTADRKQIRHYGDAAGDLGKIEDYGEFLGQLAQVFRSVLQVLRAGKYCVVVVMDIRKKERFYPYHMDLARMMVEIGFEFDDLIVWDRRHEYNHMRPLGYPYRFRVNKAHEFILIFRKPPAR